MNAIGRKSQRRVWSAGESEGSGGSAVVELLIATQPRSRARYSEEAELAAEDFEPESEDFEPLSFDFDSEDFESDDVESEEPDPESDDSDDFDSDDSEDLSEPPPFSLGFEAPPLP